VPAEVPQKTDVPFLSLNKTWTVVLGIVLAVSVIGDVYLYKLKQPMPETEAIAKLQQRLEAAYDMADKSGSKYLCQKALADGYKRVLQAHNLNKECAEVDAKVTKLKVE